MLESVSPSCSLGEVRCAQLGEQFPKRGRDRRKLILRSVCRFLCLRGEGDKRALLDERRDDHSGDPNAESLILETLLSADAIRRGHALLRRANMIVEATVLVVSDNQKSVFPLWATTESLVDVLDPALSFHHRC